MATQYLDWSFGETKPIDSALEEFMGALESGTAKAFHVGTPEQIESIKEEVCVRDEVTLLSDRLSSIEAKNSEIIISPSLDDIKRFSK